MPHILIIEDDEDIQQLVGYNLAKEKFAVSYADSGEAGLARLDEEPLPDLVVLDLMLPGISGLEVCRRIRRHPKGREIPIIMLTARGEEEDITTGLDAGADDYLTKPFSPKVLLARIRAVLRRRDGLPAEEESRPADPAIVIHQIRIDPKRHEVRVAEQLISLTVTEYSILELLARHPGWVFSRQQIIDAVRGYDYSITPRAVDVQLFGLRKKLGVAGERLETVRGIGYRLKD